MLRSTHVSWGAVNSTLSWVAKVASGKTAQVGGITAVSAGMARAMTMGMSKASGQMTNSLMGSRNYFVLAETAEERTNQNTHANLVRLASAYRTCGHAAARLDPLGLSVVPREDIPELDPAHYGLEVEGAAGEQVVSTLGLVFMPDGAGGFKSGATGKDVVAHLQAAFTGDIGAELHVPDAVERRWLTERVEAMAGGTQPAALVDASKRTELAKLLVESEGFDNFMQKKFAFVKRYGLEGAEAMLVALEGMFEASTANSSMSRERH